LPRPRSAIGQTIKADGSSALADIVYAPARLRVGNPEAFLGFIYDYRWRAYAQPPHGRRPLSISLEDVEDLSIGAALVLVAEYHRVCLIAPGYKPLINDERWPDHVRAAMEMLGFYELVDSCGRTGNQVIAATDVRFVQFVSGSRVAGDAANKLKLSLIEAAGDAAENLAIYEVLMEAMANAFEHAYPPRPYPTSIPYLKRWWAAGAYDPKTNTLEFVVYDQGVGMPRTLPPFLQTMLLTPLRPDITDADVIIEAIKASRSRTKRPERGNGLKMICGLVEELKGSFVRILSGHAEVTYHRPQYVRGKLSSNPFCGTLIQWTLKLPSVAVAEQSAT